MRRSQSTDNHSSVSDEDIDLLEFLDVKFERTFNYKNVAQWIVLGMHKI